MYIRRSRTRYPTYKNSYRQNTVLCTGIKVHILYDSYHFTLLLYSMYIFFRVLQKQQNMFLHQKTCCPHMGTTVATKTQNFTPYKKSSCNEFSFLLFWAQVTTFSLFSILSLSLSQEPFPNDATAHHEFLKNKSAELSLEEFIAALPETIRQVKEEKENTTRTVVTLLKIQRVCTNVFTVVIPFTCTFHCSDASLFLLLLMIL
jgi:hypothetical protein